ncbi:hypothetical protein AAZX31_10G066500 [Glycine max]
MDHMRCTCFFNEILGPLYPRLPHFVFLIPDQRIPIFKLNNTKSSSIYSNPNINQIPHHQIKNTKYWTKVENVEPCSLVNQKNLIKINIINIEEIRVWKPHSRN